MSSRVWTVGEYMVESEEFLAGDRDGLMLYDDYIDGYELFVKKFGMPERIHACPEAMSTLKTSTNLIQTSELLSEANALDTAVKFGIYNDICEDGCVGVMDDFPVHQMTETIHNPDKPVLVIEDDCDNYIMVLG
jgi:hypothetical protein